MAATLLSPAASWCLAQPDISELRGPLLRLWRRNLPTAAPSRFDWLYASRQCRAWLLHDATGELIGAAGLMRRRMAVCGQLVEVGAAIDLNVDERRRSVGAALTLVRAVIAAADRDQLALLYGVPILAAKSVLKRAGYRQLGEFSSWTKLLRSKTKLCKAFRSDWAGAATAPVVDFALRLLANDWRTRFPSHIVGVALPRFDERFDRLWTEAANRYGVIGDRSSDYLNWRFTNCPDLEYHVFALVERGSEALLGYVVWYATNDGAVMSDLLAIDDATTGLLLAEFSRLIRRTSSPAIRIACFGPPTIYEQLETAGFSRRQNRLPILVREAHPVCDNWYLTMADNDTDV